MSWDAIGAVGISIIVAAAVLGFLWSLGSDAGLNSIWKTFAVGVLGFVALMSLVGLIPIMVGMGVAGVTGSDLFGGLIGVISWPVLTVGSYLTADWLEGSEG